MQKHFEWRCDVLKRKRLTEQEIRWGVGFVTAILTMIAFISMLSFVGRIELCKISVAHGAVGGILSLIFGLIFFYIASVCLYDCKF